MSELNDYEKLRAERIERNNARLRSLGLISKAEEMESNASAWRKQPSSVVVSEEEGEEDQENIKSKSKTDGGKRKRSSSSVKHEGPVRKSRRLQGLGTDNQPLPPLSTKTREEIIEERKGWVRECREVRLQAAKEVAVAGMEKAAKENPTATYDHCLMRVRTMTDKALKNRIKAIERAAGKHCVVKMAIFKCCLQDQELWELAELCSDALERLKALLPPPDN